MTVQLTADQESRLDQLASASGLTRDELGLQIIDHYLEDIAALTAAVREGEESAERDGWLTHEEVFERLHARLLKPA